MGSSGAGVSLTTLNTGWSRLMEGGSQGWYAPFPTFLMTGKGPSLQWDRFWLCTWGILCRWWLIHTNGDGHRYWGRTRYLRSLQAMKQDCWWYVETVPRSFTPAKSTWRSYCGGQWGKGWGQWGKWWWWFLCLTIYIYISISISISISIYIQRYMLLWLIVFQLSPDPHIMSLSRNKCTKNSCLVGVVRKERCKHGLIINTKTTVVTTSNNYQITACTCIWYWASYQLSTVIYLVLGSIWAPSECHLTVVLSKGFESEVLQ